MTKPRQADEYNAPLVDRGGRSGTVLRILLLALVLIAAAGGFIVFKRSLDNEVVLGGLGVLAMVGIFFLVSSVIGFIEVMPQRQSDSLARAFLNSHPDGTLITDEKGRIIYANAAYGALTGARKATEVQTLETLLSRIANPTRRSTGWSMVCARARRDVRNSAFCAPSGLAATARAHIGTG